MSVRILYNTMYTFFFYGTLIARGGVPGEPISSNLGTFSLLVKYMKKELQELYLTLYDAGFAYNESLDIDFQVPIDVFIKEIAIFLSVETAFSGQGMFTYHLTKGQEDNIQKMDPLFFWPGIEATGDQIEVRYFPDDLMDIFPISKNDEDEMLYRANCHYPLLSGSTLRLRADYNGLISNLTAGNAYLLIEAKCEVYPYEVTP
jgi:hypothetical protein